MPLPFVQPQIGRLGWVSLAGYELRYEPGSYSVTEAPRFGEKISIGALEYTDFNPNESAHTVTTLQGGYGLRRYADLIVSEAALQRVSENAAITTCKESYNVDTRFVPIVLGPLQTVETLPNANGSPVWFGEWAPSAGTVTGTRFVCVAGTKVYYRTAAGSWVDSSYTLPAAPPGPWAIGVFGGNLIIGYGATRTAQYITTLDGSVALQNVTDTAGNSLYVFALTADRAAIYIAGGTLATNTNLVNSATSPTGFLAPGNSAITTCGSTDTVITGLAPGGGLYVVIVGTTKGLGYIDTTNANFHWAIPFQAALSTNCQPMGWWLGTGGQPQQGPLVVYFARGRSLWEFEPSSQTAGRARNISPWGRTGIRPPVIRGRPTAVQGTARWLYWAIITSGGHTYLLVTDSSTGNTHAWADLGAQPCNAMGITSLFGSNPLLFAGNGNQVVSIVLPVDGESPIDDPACTYAVQGTLDLPDIDIGFPDENKVWLAVRVIAEDIVAGAEIINVFYTTDGTPFSSETPPITDPSFLGTVNQGPPGYTILTFPTSLVAKRLSLKFVFNRGTTVTKTPKLYAVSVRASINPKLYRIWSFNAILPAGATALGGDDLQQANLVIPALWAARAAGTPVAFIDNQNDPWVVKIQSLQQKEVRRESGGETMGMRIIETHLGVQLLEVASGLGNLTYDSAGTVYDSTLMVYG
jgi:hypothetical protein